MRAHLQLVAYGLFGRVLFDLFALFFHFLGGLPEKKIGRNGCSEDCYQHREEAAREFEMGYERDHQRASPINMRVK